MKAKKPTKETVELTVKVRLEYEDKKARAAALRYVRDALAGVNSKDMHLGWYFETTSAQLRRKG